MNLFRRKNKELLTFPGVAKPLSVAPPPSPRQKVEEALQELSKQGAIYDVTFNGIRYQRFVANPKSPIAINEQ